MIPVDYLIRSALRFDTAVSRAMLRACGIRVPHRLPATGRIVRADLYAGLDRCFANSGSPMDGRHG